MKHEINKSKGVGIIFLLACILLFAGRSNAQLLPGIPKPKVYYSFNNNSFDRENSGYIDHYKPGNYCGGYNIYQPSQGTDRFGRQEALALSTLDNGADKFYTMFRGEVFGLGSFPDNVTIAFWVYILPNSDTYERQLCYGGANFALRFKGHDISLRRYATYESSSGSYYYKFWSPASFDIEGWHEVFLVFGKRSQDNMQYVKLYVGKPSDISYDTDGPRPVPSGTSALAWNFGGGYAFLDKDIYTGDSWGLGDKGDNVLRSPLLMDDFAVWDVALSETDAKKLFLCQRETSGRDDRCWSSSPIPESVVNARQIVKGDTVKIPLASAASLLAYASSSSTVEVKFTLLNEERVDIGLYDMNGHLIMQRNEVEGLAGANWQQLSPLSLPAGIYIIQVLGRSTRLSQKVIVH